VSRAPEFPPFHAPPSLLSSVSCPCFVCAAGWRLGLLFARHLPMSSRRRCPETSRLLCERGRWLVVSPRLLGGSGALIACLLVAGAVVIAAFCRRGAVGVTVMSGVSLIRLDRLFPCWFWSYPLGAGGSTLCWLSLGALAGWGRPPAGFASCPLFCLPPAACLFLPPLFLCILRAFCRAAGVSNLAPSCPVLFFGLGQGDIGARSSQLSSLCRAIQWILAIHQCVPFFVVPAVVLAPFQLLLLARLLPPGRRRGRCCCCSARRFRWHGRYGRAVL